VSEAFEVRTRSSAVGVIADYTAYSVQYS